VNIAAVPALTALAALCAVLALVWIAARAARLTGLGRMRQTGRLLAIEDQLALDPRRRLLLVRCADRQFLLLIGGTRDVIVGWNGQSGDG
jgi:flagellar protein FliO/FliZ